MLQQSSQFAPFSQWTCRISALQCNSLGNAFPASADSSMGLIRQLQHSFGGTAIRAQLRHSGSLLAPPAPEKCSRVAQSPLLPRAGDTALSGGLATNWQPKSRRYRALTPASAAAIATAEAETAAYVAAQPPASPLAGAVTADGDAMAQRRRKHATNGAAQRQTAEGSQLEGAEPPEPLKPAKAECKKKAKDRHLVHEIADNHVPRALPDPAMLPQLAVPNLGYCCLNVTLRNQKPEVFCNRGCFEKTFLAKGLDYVGQMALQNCRDLEPILWWNYDHGIRLFRLTSNFFPWGSKYALRELPTYEGIKAALARAGQVARATGQRMTAHPSEFVKLAAKEPKLLETSLADLELHGQVLDLMGFPPSHENKVNIHIGGAYGDKAAAMRRFADAWRQLSPGMQARLTVENDDRGSLFAVSDLLWLHDQIGIPIVFDFHHYRFCPGVLSQEESLRAAAATWPQGVRPVVHWSESPPAALGKRPHAHSDYVGQFGPMVLHGMERDVDVMIEAKAMELALLEYRDVAVNGPLLRQTGWDGIEYPGRERSSRLEGIEIIVSGDKRLQCRGHRKPAKEGTEAEAQVRAKATAKSKAKAKVKAKANRARANRAKAQAKEAALKAKAAAPTAKAAASMAKATAPKAKAAKAKAKAKAASPTAKAAAPKAKAVSPTAKAAAPKAQAAVPAKAAAKSRRQTSAAIAAALREGRKAERAALRAKRDRESKTRQVARAASKDA